MMMLDVCVFGGVVGNGEKAENRGGLQISPERTEEEVPLWRTRL